MKEFGILKLNVGNKKRSMNYTTKDSKVYVVTKRESQKIIDIKENSQVELSFEAKEIVKAEARIIDEMQMVQNIFNQLVAEDNSHFKNYNDSFVLIEFIIQ